MDFDMEDAALLEWPGKSMSISWRHGRLAKKNLPGEKLTSSQSGVKAQQAALPRTISFGHLKKLESDGDARCLVKSKDFHFKQVHCLGL